MSLERKQTKSPSASRGRPRDTATDDAILDATLELLSHVGLHGITIEAIATASGVSRPTIYRRWQSREEIVVAALMAAVRPLRDPNTGDTKRDLFSMLAALRQDLDEDVGVSVLGVHVALRTDAALAGLRERYLQPRAVVLSRVLELIAGKAMRKADLNAGFEAVWSAIAR